MIYVQTYTIRNDDGLVLAQQMSIVDRDAWWAINKEWYCKIRKQSTRYLTVVQNSPWLIGKG
jgi:hypothetical protein